MGVQTRHENGGWAQGMNSLWTSICTHHPLVMETDSLRPCQASRGASDALSHLVWAMPPSFLPLYLSQWPHLHLAPYFPLWGHGKPKNRFQKLLKNFFCLLKLFSEQKIFFLYTFNNFVFAIFKKLGFYYILIIFAL